MSITTIQKSGTGPRSKHALMPRLLLRKARQLQRPAPPQRQERLPTRLAWSTFSKPSRNPPKARRKLTRYRRDSLPSRSNSRA